MSYYGKTLGFFRTAGYDSDAQAYFTGAGITDAGQKDAWNTFVQGRKSFGYYSKFYVIHPYLGGDSTKHSYNAINTATAQLSYSGGLTHNSNGMTGNGTSGYATFTFSQATNFSEGNGSMGVYVRSMGGSGGSYFAAHLASNEYTSMLISSDIFGGTYGLFNGAEGGTTEVTNFLALNVGEYTAEGSPTDFYDKNGLASSAIVASGFGGASIKIFNYLDVYYSAANICFDYQANSLTSSEMADLISAVQTLQTSLGRQV